MAESIVSLINVEKRFGSNLVVRKMNMEIQEGEFLTLLGPSGCGKTTTLRMIAGFEDATSGIIKVQGERVESKEPYQRDVNTVFQNYALFPHMTVAANIGYSLKLKKRPKDEIKKAVDDALALVQLSGYGKRMPAELSGGQRQRVAIARALISKPAILLADEPTGNLDTRSGQNVLGLLRLSVETYHQTLVMITHNLDLAQMADRVVRMEDGHIL